MGVWRPASPPSMEPMSMRGATGAWQRGDWWSASGRLAPCRWATGALQIGEFTELNERETERIRLSDLILTDMPFRVYRTFR
jgi:hypothetical protein